MIGIKYLIYHAKVIFKLPSGPTMHKSVFENAYGARGVVGGPQKVFNSIRRYQPHDGMQLTFFSNQYALNRNGYQVNPELPLLSYTEAKQQYDICNFNEEQCENSGESFTVKFKKCLIKQKRQVLKSCIDA